jgi:hypothetical protein
MKALSFIAAALAAMVLGSSGARAATLLGDSISAAYYFPSLGTSYTCINGPCYSPSTFTVGAGIETTLAGDLENPTFDFSSNQLTITFSHNANFNNDATFNGPVFTITSGDLWGSILTVSGLPAADVTAGGNTLAINWAGLTEPFPNGGQIVITFAPVATTPLPAALPLFATGLGGLGLLGWRRKRKAQGA